MAKSKFKRWRRYLILVVVLGLVLFLGKGNILRGIGNALVVEDGKQKVDAIYVLSGNSYDRGMEGVRLYQEGWGDKLICLGGESNTVLELYGIKDLTSTITGNVMQKAGIPSSNIEILAKGSSTYEEFEAILEHCSAHQFDKVMVVSSLFHTRRIDTYFRERMHFSGIEMVLRGVQDGGFERENWWQREQGLLFVANEYIKMAYYWLRY